jgi:pimeloyl-ACP methyl ester carboxylesterase
LNERYPGFTPEYVANRLRYAFRREGGRLRLKPTGDVIRGGLAVDLWLYVERMRVPTLLLIGEESTLVSPEARTRMEGILPDLEAVVVRGACHMIPQERPGGFEVLVRRFLDKVGS